MGNLANQTGSPTWYHGPFRTLIRAYALTQSHNQLLTSKEAGKRKEKPEEDITLLDRVSEANASAGNDYLEYLVLQRKSSSAELHTRLAVLYAKRVVSFLEDETVLKLWRAKGTLSPPPFSYQCDQ